MTSSFFVTLLLKMCPFDAFGIRLSAFFPEMRSFVGFGVDLDAFFWKTRPFVHPALV